MKQYHITATLESGRQLVFTVGSGECVIGRDTSCTVCLPADSVSRQHARLVLDADGATLEDLGSTAGTFINGEAVSTVVRLVLPVTFVLGPVAVSVMPGAVADELLSTRPPSGTGSVSPPALGGRTPEVGERYAIGRQIAKGGMGAIMEAKESALDREVAMKVMLSAAETSATARQRFVREALVLARLEHPNIVPIHEMGRQADGRLFYTMKMVRGRTLQAIVSAIQKGDAETIREFTLDRLLTIFRKVCDAIAFAHHQRILHRDLKPENVMVGEYGEVLVMDWGLAKHLDDHRLAQLEGGRSQPAAIDGFQELGDSQLAAGQQGLTLEGDVMGSPQFMPPEQAEGRLADLDERSDVYSLGAVLYAILTLRPPVSGKTVSEVLRKVKSGEIVAPTQYLTAAAAKQAAGDRPEPEARGVTDLPHCPGGQVPKSLSAVTMRAMALEPLDRYPDVAGLAADVEAYQDGFATSVEEVGALGQLLLLAKRHKVASLTLLSALAVIVGLTGVFVSGLRAKERDARRAEARAIEEKDKARHAYARSQIAVAEAALRIDDYPAMVQALEACPPDERDQTWAYLSAKRDGSLGPLPIEGIAGFGPFAAVPGRPGEFALAYNSGDVTFVDVVSGSRLRTIRTGVQNPRELVFSGDGRVFAIYPRGNEVSLFNVATGAARGKIRVPGEQPVGAIALDHVAATLAVVAHGDPGRRARFWGVGLFDTGDGSLRWRFAGRFFQRIDITPDGSRVVVSGGGRNRHCVIIDGADGRIVNEHAIYAHSQALHPDGHIVAVGLHGEMLLIDTESGKLLRQTKLYTGRLESMAWTGDGHLLTMGGVGRIREDRWLFRLWEPEYFELRASYAGLDPGFEIPWELNQASGHVITRERPPRLWRVPTGREYVKFEHRSEQAWGGAFLSDTVVLARRGFGLARFDVSEAGRMLELEGDPEISGNNCAADPKNGTFATVKVIGAPPYPLRCYVADGTAWTEKLNLNSVKPAVMVALDATASRVAVTRRDFGTVVFSIRDRERRLKTEEEYERAVFVAGNRLVCSKPLQRGADYVEYALHLLDADSGELQAGITNHFQVQTLAVSPDRRLVALSGVDRKVHLYDAETLVEKAGFRAHDGEIGALAFHPAEPIIATGSSDGSVKLWDHRSGALLDTFIGLGGPPIVLSFSPNGRLLLVDGQENSTRIYEVGHVTVADPSTSPTK